MSRRSHGYWFGIVDSIAKASTCRVDIGTILLQHDRIIGTGYLGSLPGKKHCIKVGCLFVDNHNLQGSDDEGKSCIRTVHAELNAILNANKIDQSNIICYTTYAPCLSCLKALLGFGVHCILYLKPYKDIWRDKFIADVEKEIHRKIQLVQW